MINFLWELVRELLGFGPSRERRRAELERALETLVDTMSEMTGVPESVCDSDDDEEEANGAALPVDLVVKPLGVMARKSMLNQMVVESSEYQEDDRYCTPSQEEAKALIKAGHAMRKQVHDRVVSCTDRIVEMDNGITFMLDDVSYTYIPIPGDLLSLWIVVEVNANANNLSGRVLVVERMSPVRSQLIEAHVTKWTRLRSGQMVGELAKRLNKHGKAEFRVFFDEDACSHKSYIPCQNDRVRADIIESKQGVYEWRATLVYPRKEASRATEKDEELIELLQQWDDVIIPQKTVIEKPIVFQETATIQMAVANRGLKQKILSNVCPHPRLCKNPQFGVDPSSPPFPITLDPQESVQIMLKCTGEHLGIATDLVVFEFEVSDGPNYCLGRYIEFTVVGEHFEMPSTSSCSVGYSRSKREIKNPWSKNSGVVLRGRSNDFKTDPFARKIPIFEVPEDIRKLALHPNIRSNKIFCLGFIQEFYPQLLFPLTKDTYRQLWHDILYLEEAEMTVALEEHDMDFTTIAPTCDRAETVLQLEVPGLKENRPSIILGDVVRVTPINDERKHYEGVVVRVLKDSVHLNFHKQFNPSLEERFKVHFVLSRMQFRRMHLAVKEAWKNLGPQILFPLAPLKCQLPQVLIAEDLQQESFSGGDANSNTYGASRRIPVAERLFNAKTPPMNNNGNNNNYGSNRRRGNRRGPRRGQTNDFQTNEPDISQVRVKKIRWHNGRLNNAQRTAVKNVLRGEARPMPYIIFGPPGTGKTVTIVETILQIYFLFPNSRLLVGAPSNSAADLLAERLLDTGYFAPGQLVRLVAISYEQNMPARLAPYKKSARVLGGDLTNKFSNLDKDFEGCMEDEKMLQRITIGTCSTLGKIIMCHNVKENHFTHMIIDEAGQATEPETLLMAGMLGKPEQIILAGDPKQLGPVVQGRASELCGLGNSWLSRMLASGPYIRDSTGFPNTQGYDPRLVTMLVENYRSMPEILALPSKLFYNNELVPTVSTFQGYEANMLAAVQEFLPRRRQGGPPSLVFFGVQGQCVRHPDSPSWYNNFEVNKVTTLVTSFLRKGLQPHHIGIITPYSKQVQMIRKTLQNLLIRTHSEMPKVGSVEEFQGQERHVIIFSAVRCRTRGFGDDSVGFLSNAHRMNTAITRARALLVVVGDPVLLEQDTSWRALVVDCVERSAYQGCSYSPPKQCFNQTEEEEERA